MICNECGATSVRFRPARLFLRRLATGFAAARYRTSSEAARRDSAAPSVTELVALVERETVMTNFG